MGGVSAEDNKVLPTGDARFHGAPAEPRTGSPTSRTHHRQQRTGNHGRVG